MFEILQPFLPAGINLNPIYLAGIGLGCIAGLFGLYNAFSGPEQYVRRFRPEQSERPGTIPDDQILKGAATTPSPFLKALVPEERKKLTSVQRQLFNAGYTGKDSVLNFYLMRAFLGLFLPSILLVVSCISTVSSNFRR